MWFSVIMNKIVLSLAIIALLVGCQAKQNQKETSSYAHHNVDNVEDATTHDVAFHTSEMKIEGMMCAIGCAKKIENNLNNTPGVNKATVDFEAKTALIEYDANLIDEKGLASVVTNSGDYTIITEEKVEKKDL